MGGCGAGGPFQYYFIPCIQHVDREKERADIAQIGKERCYATEGSGEYGWCKVRYESADEVGLE